MSQRWNRALLKLYPSRIRHRYGDELLDLQDELRDRGEISAVRLLRDAIAGAFLVRPARQRALVLGSAVFVAALIAAGIALHGGNTQRAAPPVALVATRADTTRPAIPYGQTCFVSSGMSCSLQACSVSTAESSTQPAAAQPAQTRSTRRAPHAKAVCVGHSRTPEAHARYVSSAGSPRTTGG